jgi:hypothetical protein
MNGIRGPVPLTDDDFARIRANVMARVRPRRSAFVLRWSFAMLAAAFVGVVSYESMRVTPVSLPTLPPRHAERSEAPPLPVPNVNLEEPPHAVVRTRAIAKPRIRAEEPSSTTQFRMEIQTSDPDIRIIWLPNQHDPKTEEHS